MAKLKIPRTAFLTLYVGVLRVAICRSVFSPHSASDLKDAVQKCFEQSSAGSCSQSEFGPIELWDVSDVTDMTFLFDKAKVFNTDISNWNVSRVADMSGMFHQAISFNQDISKWKVSHVTDMSLMFYDATSFDNDIADWDVSHVTDMSLMFYEAISFNKNISEWDVSNVTDMSSMFNKAASFAQTLCGRAWIHSTAERRQMFKDSPGSIESTCATPKPTDITPILIAMLAVIVVLILTLATIALVLTIKLTKLTTPDCGLQSSTVCMASCN